MHRTRGTGEYALPPSARPGAPDIVTTATTHRPDVQALRGIAVLLVVVYHAWPELLPGGYVGVDVFFVISGYLITGLLLREIEATGKIDFSGFYARRIRRLLPAAALVTATTTLLVWLYQSPLEARDFAPTAIATALYVSNFWFAHLSVDYLQEGLRGNLLLHTWSLGVEEQFYLVWPALIVGATLCLRRAGRRRAIAWMVAGVAVLSFVACIALTATLQSWAFFGLPTRAWELGVGAAATLLDGRARTLGAATQRTLTLAGLLCAVGAGFLLSDQTRFPGYAALLPVAGAFLVITGGAGDAGRKSGVLRLTPLQRLGDLSYSWYLWHWPVLILVAERWPAADRNLMAALGVVLSLGLARLTYAFVENPVRHHAALQTKPARSFLLAAALTLAVLGIAGSMHVAASRGHAAETRQRIEQAARDWPRLYPDKCFAAALESEPPECDYGDPAGRRTIALVGDSHAAQWFPALERIALEHGLRLAVFVKAACPVAAVEPFDAKLRRPYVECTQWREQVFEQLARLRPVLVVAGNSSAYDAFIKRDSAAQAEWQRGLETSLERLGHIADHVVLVRDTPRPGFHVPTCLARALSRGEDPFASCRFARSSAVLPDPVTVERAAVGRHPGVAYVDMNDVVCSEPECPVGRDGVVLYHDTQHLSATLARSLAGEFWNRLPEDVRADLDR